MAVWYFYYLEDNNTISFQKAMCIASSLWIFTHLFLDEYSSLTLQWTSRIKPKRSLGTALDFNKPNKRVTVIAYLLLTGLLVVIIPQWNAVLMKICLVLHCFHFLSYSQLLNGALFNTVQSFNFRFCECRQTIQYLR